MWTGYFDSHHTAHLRFSLHNPKSSDGFQLEGIIDTGFTGFVQVPPYLATALRLLTPPLSWGNTILADGTTQQVVLQEALVSVESETRNGICQIPMAQDSPILIGMDFLRRFDRLLIVSNELGVRLVPESDYRKRIPK